jgi:hypothetical protein
MGLEGVTRDGVVIPVRVDPPGEHGPTPKAVRGRRRPRVTRGWYVDAGADPDRLDQRIVEAMAGLPDEAAVTGWAALAWQHARWFSGRQGDGQPLPVPVALPENRVVRARRASVSSEDWLFESDVMVVDGLRITVPNRSVTYETRRARTLPRAVAAVDMAAYDDLIDLETLAAYVDRLICRQGIKLTRRALPLARENVWSPTESFMRRAWEDAFPGAVLLCNAPIFDLRGNRLLTPDLFDPAAAVAGEYDGKVHEEDGVRRRDLDKEAAYRQHGIELVSMVSVDRHDTHNFEVRLRAVYERAGRRRPAATWTLDQPDWWVDTSTVALRRALTAEQAALWLRRRSL